MLPKVFIRVQILVSLHCLRSLTFFKHLYLFFFFFASPQIFALDFVELLCKKIKQTNSEKNKPVKQDLFVFDFRNYLFMAWTFMAFA